MAKKAVGQAEHKRSKGAATAKTKPSGQPEAAGFLPFAQMQQSYGNSAVLKYLQAGAMTGQMSYAPAAANRYEGTDNGASLSKAGGKPESAERAEAFAAVARPPTADELLNAKRNEKQKDDRKAWNKIRKDKEIQDAITEAAELTGIEAAMLETMIVMESAGNKSSVSDSGYYHGLMQMGYSAFQDVRDKGAMKKLFDTLTVTDAESGEERAIAWDDVKSDPRANVLVGAIYAQGNLNQIRSHNAKVSRKRSERVQPAPICMADAPATYVDSPVDDRADGVLLDESAQNLYFAHQQGFNGMVGIYEKPDAAIGGNQRGNMMPFDKEHFVKEGPGEKITNAEYLEAWNERMSRIDQFMKEGEKDDG